MAATSLRFYLDENVPIEIARQLAARRIDAVTVRDLGLLGAEDIDHLAKATEMGRVLCTYDTDYVKLATEGVEHAGIVLGQPEDHYIGEWVSWLELMYAVYTAEDIKIKYGGVYQIMAKSNRDRVGQVFKEPLVPSSRPEIPARSATSDEFDNQAGEAQPRPYGLSLPCVVRIITDIDLISIAAPILSGGSQALPDSTGANF